MEEILASIRRIIADDDAAKPLSAAEPLAPASVSQAPRAVPPPASQPPHPVQMAASPLPPMPEPFAAPAPQQIESLLAELSAGPVVAPPPSAPPRAVETSPPDVLELTEAMAMAPPAPGPAEGFRTIDGTHDVMFDERSAESVEMASPEPRWEPHPPRSAKERPLLSQATSSVVDSAFNTLAHTVLVQNARTLEDLVREMLRPLLKTWLDDNLPGLVERLVRAEIERVSRGRT
jgi:cell pole-organizing protein PopZ